MERKPKLNQQKKKGGAFETKHEKHNKRQITFRTSKVVQSLELYDKKNISEDGRPFLSKFLAHFYRQVRKVRSKADDCGQQDDMVTTNGSKNARQKIKPKKRLGFILFTALAKNQFCVFEFKSRIILL